MPPRKTPEKKSNGRAEKTNGSEVSNPETKEANLLTKIQGRAKPEDLKRVASQREFLLSTLADIRHEDELLAELLARLEIIQGEGRVVNLENVTGFKDLEEAASRPTRIYRQTSDLDLEEPITELQNELWNGTLQHQIEVDDDDMEKKLTKLMKERIEDEQSVRRKTRASIRKELKGELHSPDNAIEIRTAKPEDAVEERQNSELEELLSGLMTKSTKQLVQLHRAMFYFDEVKRKGFLPNLEFSDAYGEMKKIGEARQKNQQRGRGIDTPLMNILESLKLSYEMDEKGVKDMMKRVFDGINNALHFD